MRISMCFLSEQWKGERPVLKSREHNFSSRKRQQKGSMGQKMRTNTGGLQGVPCQGKPSTFFFLVYS